MAINNHTHVSARYEQVDLHAQIEGANAHDLIDLLYKGAIAKLAKAKGHISHQNIAAKGQEISKVIAILTELQSCLSNSTTSDISQNLIALYTYVTDLIVDANIKDDQTKLDEAIGLLSHLRESWNLIPNDQRY